MLSNCKIIFLKKTRMIFFLQYAVTSKCRMARAINKDEPEKDKRKC